LFIDEILNSKTAITKLRYFYEAKLSDLYVIAAGSLLETMLNENISFPVGRIEYLAVRPCVFNEFRRAIGEIQLEKALFNCKIPEALHGKTMNLFNRFTLIDCGLVNYAAKVQKELFGAMDILDAWRGKIAEQIVAQELLALDYRVSNVRNFWVRNKKDSEAEVDFVLQFDNKVIPIEVKSGHNAKLRSLHLFMDDAPHNIAVRVWSQPFSIDEVKTQKGKSFKLLNVPFYYVGRLEGILNNVIAKC